MKWINLSNDINIILLTTIFIRSLNQFIENPSILTFMAFFAGILLIGILLMLKHMEVSNE